MKGGLSSSTPKRSEWSGQGMDQAPAPGRNPASIWAQATNRMTQTPPPAARGQCGRSSTIRERRGLVTQEGAGTAREAAQDDRAVVTFTVRDARPVSSKSLYALVDVELEIAGVAIVIRGIQARHAPGGGTLVELPATTCLQSGGWSLAPGDHLAGGNTGAARGCGAGVPAGGRTGEAALWLRRGAESGV